MSLQEMMEPHPDFPEKDTLIKDSGIFVDLLKEPRALEEQHMLAEGANAFYATGHLALAGSLDRIEMKPKEKQAVISGARAFEALGGLALPVDRHNRYETSMTSSLMGELWNPRNFSLNFIDFMRESSDRLVDETPVLAEMIADIVRADISDASEELVTRAHMGAGVLRVLQIDVDAAINFEDELRILG